MNQRVPFDVWKLIFDAVMMNNDDTALPRWKLVCKTFYRVSQRWHINMLSTIKRLAGCETTLTSVGNGRCSLCESVFSVTGIPVGHEKLFGSSKYYCFRCVVNKSDDVRQKITDELMVYARVLQMLTGMEPLKYSK